MMKSLQKFAFAASFGNRKPLRILATAGLPAVLFFVNSCKHVPTSSNVQGVSTNVNQDEAVWEVKKEWSPMWEERYSAFITENYAVDTSTVVPDSPESGNTLMEMRFISKIQYQLSALGVKDTLDCADNVMAFRAIFSKQNQLPFMLTVKHRKSGKIWFVGHFGFRSSDNYDANDISTIIKTYSKKQNPEDRFALFLSDLAINFGVANLSAQLGSAKSDDIYDIAPRSLRPGDIFVSAAGFGTGGHSLTLAEIDFSVPPYIHGFSYVERDETFISYLAGTSFAKGSGLKRWKWAQRKRLARGGEIWVNEVQTGDQVFQAEYDTKGKPIERFDRGRHFADFLKEKLMENGQTLENATNAIIDSALLQVKKLANRPSTCHGVDRLETATATVDAFGSLVGLAQDVALRAHTVGRGIEYLLEIFYRDRGYYDSALCGWNSSDKRLFDRIILTNADALSHFQRSLSLPGFTSLKDFYRVMNLEEPSNSDADARLSPPPDLLDRLELMALVSSSGDKYWHFSDPKTAANVRKEVAEGKMSYRLEEFGALTIAKFSDKTLCFFAPPHDPDVSHWQIDEPWLSQPENKRLHPVCYT